MSGAPAPSEVLETATKANPTPTPTPTPDPQRRTPAPEADPGSPMTREERIRAHRERIDSIIRRNREKQQTAQRAALQKADSRREKQVWVVRVGKGLTDGERRHLEEQLTRDGFKTPVLLRGQMPELNSFNVGLEFSNRADAMLAEQKLRALGYQFGSIRYCKIIEQLPVSQRQPERGYVPARSARPRESPAQNPFADKQTP